MQAPNAERLRDNKKLNGAQQKRELAAGTITGYVTEPIMVDFIVKAKYAKQAMANFAIPTIGSTIITGLNSEFNKTNHLLPAGYASMVTKPYAYTMVKAEKVVRKPFVMKLSLMLPQCTKVTDLAHGMVWNIK